MSKRCCIHWCVSCLFSTLIFSPLLNAEQLSLPSGDLIAPMVTFDPPTEPVVAGGSQKITATVSDNVGVQSVTLFYRVVGKGVYQRILMTGSQSSNRYSTRIFDVEEPGIEYYIQAMDFAGNTVLSGQSFSPLLIDVAKAPSVPPPSSLLDKTVPVDSVKVVEPPKERRLITAEKKTEKSSSSKWLWIGLGALAVGGLAASVGGQTADAPTSSGTGTGTIVISAPTP